MYISAATESCQSSSDDGLPASIISSVKLIRSEREGGDNVGFMERRREDRDGQEMRGGRAENDFLGRGEAGSTN